MLAGYLSLPPPPLPRDTPITTTAASPRSIKANPEPRQDCTGRAVQSPGETLGLPSTASVTPSSEAVDPAGLKLEGPMESPAAVQLPTNFPPQTPPEAKPSSGGLAFAADSEADTLPAAPAAVVPSAATPAAEVPSAAAVPSAAVVPPAAVVSSATEEAPQLEGPQGAAFGIAVACTAAFAAACFGLLWCAWAVPISVVLLLAIVDEVCAWYCLMVLRGSAPRNRHMKDASICKDCHEHLL